MEQATEDIIKELKGRRGAETRPYRMSADERRYYEALVALRLWENVEHEVRERVAKALSTGALRPLHRSHEWRELHREWRSGGHDTSWLAAQLDEMAVANGLYSDVSFGPVGALRAVQEQNLQLVCYELIV